MKRTIAQHLDKGVFGVATFMSQGDLAVAVTNQAYAYDSYPETSPNQVDLLEFNELLEEHPVGLTATASSSASTDDEKIPKDRKASETHVSPPKPKRRRMRRNREYFAAAAKRSREKKRQKEIELRERIAKLESEQPSFKRRIRDLELEVEAATLELNPSKAKTRKAKYEFENFLLRREIKRHRIARRHVQNLLASFNFQESTIESILHINSTARNFTDFMKSTCYLSMKSDSWRRMLPRNNTWGGAYSACDTQYRLQIKDNFIFRQDVLGIPLSLPKALKALNIIVRPEISNEVKKAIFEVKGGNISFTMEEKSAASNTDEEFEIPASAEDMGCNGERAQLVKYQEHSLKTGHVATEYFVRVAGVEKLHRSYFLEHSTLNEGNSDYSETFFFGFRTVTESPSKQNRADATNFQNFMQGVFITKGRNSTVNMTTIQQQASLDWISERLKLQGINCPKKLELETFVDTAEKNTSTFINILCKIANS